MYKKIDFSLTNMPVSASVLSWKFDKYFIHQTKMGRNSIFFLSFKATKTVFIGKIMLVPEVESLHCDGYAFWYIRYFTLVHAFDDFIVVRAPTHRRTFLRMSCYCQSEQGQQRQKRRLPTDLSMFLIFPRKVHITI